VTAALERSVERYLLSRSRESGFLCLKLVLQGRAGVPDRIVVTPGGTVCVEVKRPGERLRRLQAVTVTKLRRAGGAVHVVDDKDSVDRLLQRLHEGVG
jgi:Holliday junction resolvase